MLPDVQEIRIHFYNFLKIFFPILFWKWQQLLHGRLGRLGLVCVASQVDEYLNREMTVGVTRYITNLLMNLTKHNKKMKPRA